jgi:hypothetical protein
MTIPVRSDILIEGVNPANLALAVLLSKNGATVLMVDENSAITPFEPVVLNQYCFDFLTDYGFEFSDDEQKDLIIQSDKFAQQSFKILATHLCSIIWGVTFNNRNSTLNEYMLHHDGKFSVHQTHFLVSQLNFKTENSFIDFKRAFLLAWRLTGVFVEKSLGSKCLSSYFTESVLLQNQYLAKLKDKKNSNKPTWLKYFKVKNKDYNLIESKANLHLSMYRDLQAGDFLPNISFFDEKAKEYTSLHKWCNYRYFSVIIFGSIIQPNLFSLARWIQLNYPVQLFYLPWSKRNQELFTELNILEDMKKTIIVRPDKYIGLLHDGIDVDIIGNYLANFVNMKEKVKAVEG